MSLRSRVAAGCVCALSSVGGFVSAESAVGSAHAMPAEVVQQTAPHNHEPGHTDPICTGAAPAVGAALALRRTVVSGGQEQLELELTAENKTARGARVVYSVDVLDDLGAEVATPELRGVFALPGNASQSLGTFLTPATLADGFYEVRVQLGSESGGVEEGARLEQYVEVTAGRVIPIDFEEWTARSRAGEGQ